MCPGLRCWGLGSPLLLLLLGRNLGFLVEIPQDAVSGTAGQSVLLPVSYRFISPPQFPMAIQWLFDNISQKVISCSVQNCSLGAGGAPEGCFAQCFAFPAYRDRMELFPENASLLLRDLRLSDSGLYSVSFQGQSQTRHLTLTVHEQRVPPDHPEEATKSQDHIRNITGVCSLISVLLLFLVFCVWRRGAVQWKKMRIIKQRQALNAEEIPMANTVLGDVTTIYARAGNCFEQPQLRALPEVVYTSITSPDPPGLDWAAPPRALAVGAASSRSTELCRR